MTTRNLVRQSCGRYLAVLLLCGAGTALAQNTPEMREILKRLDRLEQDNQALTGEIRSLRKELATLRAPAPASVLATEVASDEESPAVPAQQPSVDDRLDVHQ